MYKQRDHKRFRSGAGGRVTKIERGLLQRRERGVGADWVGGRYKFGADQICIRLTNSARLTHSPYRTSAVAVLLCWHVPSPPQRKPSYHLAPE